MMKCKLVKTVIAATVLASVYGCGGGGEEESKLPDFGELDRDQTTFPLAEWDSKQVMRSSYTPVVRTGVTTGTVTTSTVKNGSVRELIKVTTTRLQDQNFEGILSIPFKSVTSRAERTLNGVYYPDFASERLNFYNKSTADFLGGYSQSLGSGYLVVSRALPFPKGVKAGDSGLSYEGILYRDSNKNQRIGTVSYSWKIDSVRLGSILSPAYATISYITTEYDNNLVMLSRVTSTNEISHDPFSDSIFESGSSSKRIKTYAEDYAGAQTGVTITIWD